MSTNRAAHVTLFKPDLSLWGPLTTEVFPSPSEELLEEVLAYYDQMLVPELVCSPTAPDRPQRHWVQSEGKKIVTCRDESGTLLGCWILKESQIMYPVINVTKGAVGCMPILRALAYASFESEGFSMWASTDNSLIKAWVNNATSTPEEGRPENMPLPRFNPGSSRVEWSGA